MGFHSVHEPVRLTQREVQDWSAEAARRFRLQEFSVYLTPTDDLRLALIVVSDRFRSQGRGTAALRALCRFADLHGRRIVLTPAEAGGAYGTTSRARLERFYGRFGFRPAAPGELDAVLLDGMLREPGEANVEPAATPGPARKPQHPPAWPGEA